MKVRNIDMVMMCICHPLRTFYAADIGIWNATIRDSYDKGVYPIILCFDTLNTSMELCSNNVDLAHHNDAL